MAAPKGLAAPFGVASAVRYVRETRHGGSPRALSLAVGLSESYVGKLEAGKLEPSLRAFALLARELRMTEGEVFVVVMHEAATQPFDVTPSRHDGRPS